MKFDELVVRHVGEFGTSQKIQFLLVCLPTIITAMHALSWTFAASDVLHRCRLGDEPPNSSYWISNEQMARKSLVVKDKCALNEMSRSGQCPYIPCKFDEQNDCPNGYIFDYSYITYSAIHRWEIVCHRDILKAVVQSAYYIGQMAGSLVFGYLGDRIGRKKVFFIAIILQILSGIGMALAPHWALFFLLRVVVGFSHPGIFVIAVVIGMELVGPTKRKIAAIVPGLCFAIGQMILGILAYFIRDYRILQAVIASPAILCISYWWFIPESSRWLISQQRFEEADKILRKAAESNGKELPKKWWLELDDIPLIEDSLGEKVSKKRRYNFLDLFRTSKMRQISLAILFCWPIVSMVYYGMAMKTDFLGGDMYSTFVFGAFVEIPAVLAVYFLLDRIGRKRLLAGGFLLTAICLLSNLITMGDHWIIGMAQFLFGKAAITLTYASIYTFTPELFPTVIRNMAFGVCSMMARTGAIIASFVVMWLVGVYGRTIIVFPFALLSILAAIISWLILPETMGRDLQETIEEVEGIAKSYEMDPLESKREK